MPEERLDTTETVQILDELRELLVDLNGSRPNIEPNNKAVNQAKARINKRLLYGAHLADVVRVDIMSLYHLFKGEDPPYPTAPPTA